MKIVYKASTKSGELKEGIIEARDINQAVFFIRSKDMLPIVVKEKTETTSFNTMFNKVSTKDIVVFTRQLASMMSSGLTLIQALGVLRDQIQKPALKEIVAGIISDVQEGRTFSSAIEKYPKTFTPVYISLVKSGEASGLLDKIFTRLADNLEKSQKLRATITSALIYPVIIIVMMVLVVIVMMIFVIPQLESLYKGLGSNLPAATQFIIFLSHATSNYWPILIGLVFLIVFIYKRWMNTDLGRIINDKLVISIPIIGKLVRLAILTEFARTLGLLINAGTLVVESLRQTAGITGNKFYTDAITDISHRVEKGITIGDAMATYDLFPPVLVQMIHIGEQTGKLDESLLKVSEYFSAEVEGQVKILTTAIEPAIMVILGLGIAFLLVAIITPIYNITSQIH